ncbi:hypothetical protein [Chromobacterium subtsugae]|uniref:hypothetical protein n=1 Tax=Chromobacterium subtsugae TaxID=251747 RepID=UPI00128B3863|nr:hypothetical protein [Chromobacterium subtsugae]
MRYLISLLVALSSFQAPPAFAENKLPEKWGLPDPDVVIHAVNKVCEDQRNSVLVAIGLRNEGYSLDQVLKLVPQDIETFRLRSVEVMRENAEDVFKYKSISPYSFVVFRSEMCLREVMEIHRYPKFGEVADQVESCQKLHGKERSNGLFQCIRKVVRASKPLI